MKQWVVGMAAAAAVCIMTSGLAAQASGGPSRADFGVYAGGAWTSPWLEAGDGTTFGIGFNPIVGGVTNVWFSPRVGARLHFAYMPSDMVEADPADAIEAIPQRDLHNFLYDLSLAYRPLASRGRTGALSSLYLFAGGGALTVNAAEGGEEDGRCVHLGPLYINGGACLPTDWQDATVAQFTAGAGLARIPLTRRLGLFLEGGLHAYSSPIRTGEDWTGIPPCPTEACRVERRTAMTVRLGGGLALALGAFAPPVVPFVPPPPPPPVTPPEDVTITLCVVADGIPQYVEARIRQPSGDTVVVSEQGIQRPLRAAYPPAPTASGRDWFTRDENVFLDGREFVRFGVPRELPPEQIRRVGEYQGVPLFAAPGAESPPAIMYVPVQDGCVFQPYEPRRRVERVRG